MKNLVHFNENSLSIYTKALDKKQDNDMKTRLSAVLANITNAYSQYDDAFGLNRLENLVANPLFTPHKNDLSGLYKFTSATVRNLKEAIDKLQPFALGNTCQNCTINSVNSMDHVLGQAGFPEYCVHPLNLFPSCIECNGYKSASFVRNGNRRFLNLYCDTLPDVQYLFLQVFTNANGDLDYSFEVRNTNGLSDNLFGLISSHYSELRLFKRMKDQSIKYYNELRNTVQSRLDDVSWDVVTRQVRKEALDNMNNLGLNHFQYVLNIAMVESPLFRASFE